MEDKTKEEGCWHTRAPCKVRRTRCDKKGVKKLNFHLHTEGEQQNWGSPRELVGTERELT